MNWWPLAGVALVVLGFALRFNPVLVVVTSGIATGLIAGIAPLDLLALIGESFKKGRYLLVLVLMLPVVGLLERNGLREAGRDLHRAPAPGHDDAAAGAVPRAPADHGRNRPAQQCRSRPDGAAVARADGRSRRDARARTARTRDARETPGAQRRDRQRRLVLRRRHLLCVQRRPAHAGVPGRQRHRDRPVADRALGNSHGSCRVRHPCIPHLVVRASRTAAEVRS